MTLADFPRHRLTFGPSPVHPLPRLTAHLGGASVWAKREDCNSGLAYGGNKTRKLEYIVPDALAQGADTLVSIGGYQSNHTRQVAAVAASLGLKAVLVQENWVDWPDCVNDRVGNIMLSRIMGAEVRLDPAGFGIGFKDSWNRAIEDVQARGGTPYPIDRVAHRAVVERHAVGDRAQSLAGAAPHDHVRGGDARAHHLMVGLQRAQRVETVGGDVEERAHALGRLAVRLEDRSRSGRARRSRLWTPPRSHPRPGSR